MSPVIPGMVFIIHWFDHQMNLHKNKAWWIHYLMIPVIMITPLILIIRCDETGRDGNNTTTVSASPNQRPVLPSLSNQRPWSQFTSVWGPFTDNDLCPVSLPRPALLSSDSNWFVYHHVDRVFPVYWRYQRHQTPAAAMIPMIIIPGLSWSCGGSPADTNTSHRHHLAFAKTLINLQARSG